MDKKIKITKTAIHSNWAVSELAARTSFSNITLKALSRDPLSRDLFPTAAGYYPLASGHNMHRRDPHDHLLIYCVEGRGSLQLNEKHYKVGPGSLIILPSGVPHSYASDIDNPWSIYWVHFQGDASHYYLRRLSTTLAVSNIGVHRTIINAFILIITTATYASSVEDYLLTSSYLRTLIIRMVTCSQSERQRATKLKQKFEAYFSRNLGRSLNLQSVCQEFEMPPQKLRRTFKAIYQDSPMSYFNAMKMNRAALMLEQTHLSVRDIARHIGMKDALYFSRAFRKKFNCSPTEFRERS